MMHELKTFDWLTTLPVAHRGLHKSSEIPENSLASFQNAIDHNFPIELDVQRLADGNVAVFHDSELHRLTGIKGKLGSLSASEAQAMYLLGSNEHIPLLQETLCLVNSKVPLLIEIKNDAGKVGPLEAALVEILADYSGEYAIQSFNPMSLSYMRINAPQIRIGQLACNYSWLKNLPESLLLTNLMRESEPDFIAYDVDELPAKATELSKDRNIPLLAWTVRTAEQEQRAMHYADNYIFEGIDPCIRSSHF